MEYSIRELSELAGVSARTLRYYDEIGLLKPLRINDAGYRYYGEQEAMLLQQILFYREREFDLKTIRQILYQDDFRIMNALEEHLLELEEKRRHMDLLIRTVKKTISSMKGECEMSAEEKFEAFKEKLVKENEERYGAEIREQYGDDEIQESNRIIRDMTEAEYERFQNLGTEILTRLKEGVRSAIEPNSEEAKRIVILHKEWLGMTWREYTVKAHQAMANMYISDERFKLYYDKDVPGCAKLLEQSIRFWVDKI